jgi:hypothetical protein
MISLPFVLFYFILELLGSMYLIIGCPPSTILFCIIYYFHFRKTLIFFINMYCGMYEWTVIILLR